MRKGVTLPFFCFIIITLLYHHLSEDGIIYFINVICLPILFPDFSLFQKSLWDSVDITSSINKRVHFLQNVPASENNFNIIIVQFMGH